LKDKVTVPSGRRRYQDPSF